MRPYDIIKKKREGKKLTEKELDFLIEGYTKGEIPDYQLSAWAMAVFFQGLDEEETASLTEIMAQSGDTIDLSKIKGIKVDKHSTGGVGDTTTLVLAPLVAACKAPVAKMSGRGLGHTGGTIDKLESIPDFDVSLTQKEFIDSVNEQHIAVAGQTGDLAPADKKLYALRDVTATVDSIPLIASSIMSKKIASGADAITLDVKVGSGAFMKEYEGAKELAQTMVKIGNNVGRNTVAVISDMDQPLGFAVGNALEVKEAIKTLQGDGPTDLTELCLTLGSQMLVLGEVAKDEKEARAQLEEAIDDGSALEKFKEMISNQGGSVGAIEDLDLLPQAKNKLEVKASTDGYIQRIKAEEVGISAMMLGAGRETKESTIDLAVGVKLAKKVGDEVAKGEKIATLYFNDDQQLKEAKEKLLSAYQISSEKPEVAPLVYEVIK
ncbi:pyrimidine-nucleoside phosphorylase [Halobacteroides halobius DSM 5150]|uniref:Pyrimidine-nucleoside phosphorylase n=1 Tax=Halobacteroides halobius (strain ATCC 35273 / DSM 5150 / MD-1) TaxID=748449 RepID=L0KBP9_HALHC|nr:pyrimidine-nucleoside phosphorylase [Halobacteroides halobius]AGB41513.1 pyrimidine-nucleoside phosphorylase [Halobacteroides halobius DSM 5150]